MQNEDLRMYLEFRHHIDALYFPNLASKCNIIRAYEKNKQVGILITEGGYIHAIWMDPEYRGQGKARKMVYEYIDKYGLPERLCIIDNNNVAKKFWNNIFKLTELDHSHNETLYRIDGTICKKTKTDIFTEAQDVIYEGQDECDDILCPNCKYPVSRNDDYKEMRPKHCPECGCKLKY